MSETDSCAVITPESVLQRLRDEGGPLKFFEFFGSQDELEPEDRADLKRCLEALKAEGRIGYSTMLHAYMLTEPEPDAAGGETSAGQGETEAPAGETDADAGGEQPHEHLGLDDAAEVLLGALGASDNGLTFEQIKGVAATITPSVAGLALGKLKRTGRARRTTHITPSTWYVVPRHDHVAEWDAEAGRKKRAEAEARAERPSDEPEKINTPPAGEASETSEPFALVEDGPTPPGVLAELVRALRAAYVRESCDAEVLDAFDRALEALGTAPATERARQVLHEDRAKHVKIRVGPQVLEHLDQAEMALANLARYYPLPGAGEATGA